MESTDMKKKESAQKRICIAGVGGAGCNTLSRMLEGGLLPEKEGLSLRCIAVNTHAAALDLARADIRLLLGEELACEEGCGQDAALGRDAAEESFDEIRDALQGSDAVFILAGLGGGTGTGASPVIAEAAKSLGAFTAALVTTPFSFEGKKGKENAKNGLALLKNCTDLLTALPNDGFMQACGRAGTMADAFAAADRAFADIIRKYADGEPLR